MKLEEIENLLTIKHPFDMPLENQRFMINACILIPKLIAVAKAAKRICEDIEFCGAGAIDGEFGSDVSETYHETMDALRDLEKA